MRHPAVAGSFYPRNPESLIAMLKEYVSPNPDPRFVACVSPHAGYMYSGRTAGKILSLTPRVDTYVILGPNHTGYGSPVAVGVDSWMTPLGVVEVDQGFVDAMPKIVVVTDDTAHRYEHSLEVQIPFLQFLHGDIKIVPICLGLQDQETAKEVCDEIIKAEEETGKRIVVIASSDMHHYLPDDECRRLDGEVIDAIISMDISAYYRRIYDMQASVCGYGTIGVAMYYAKHKNARAELVDYSTSGDVADRSSVVGYAGIAFRV
mgnify:CR=1 FL=1